MAERGSILCNDAHIGALMNSQKKGFGLLHCTNIFRNLQEQDW